MSFFKSDATEAEEEFCGQMDAVLQHNALGVAIAVGHRTGLIQKLTELQEPKTSTEIANATGLNERYVREWLAILVTSSIVNMDKEKDTYFLPRHCVSYFKSHSNCLLFEELFMMFAPILPQIQQCFKNGGGIPYSSYEEFHQVMSVFSKECHNQTLIQKFLPSIEGMQEKLESGIRYLDVGCGVGIPCMLMAKQYPKSEFYGFDFSEKAINEAREMADSQGLKNVHLVLHDCAVFDSKYEEMFDFITAFDSIHDQARPAEVLSNIYKMLKHGGIFSMVDVNSFSNPADNIGTHLSALKYAISLLHCMPVSLYFDGGVGLGTCWGRELAMKMLKEAGFSDTEERALEWNTFNVHYLSKKN